MVKKIIVVFTLLATTIGFAQKSNTSAYSFFGIGDKNSSNTVEQMSMGGIGVATSSLYRLNLANPASSAKLFITNYALGIENKQMSVKDGLDSQRASAAYLSYMIVGLPLSEKSGMYFGLIPNTSVGYSLFSNIYDVDETLIEASLYEGNGGSNRVFTGFGFTLFKGFRLGLEGSYIFGKIENSITNQVKDASLATKYKTVSRLKGTSVTTGFQFETTVKNDVKLHVGGSFSLESELNTEGDENLYSVSIGTFESPRDTILSRESVGKLRSPLKSTVGVGIGAENKWFAGIDYSMQQALELEGSVLNSYNKINYDKYSKFAIGGYFIPKYNSITSFWDRVTYRAGLKMEKTGLLVNPTGSGGSFEAIDDFGISFGIGLPLSNTVSNLNFGVELGKRGKTGSGLVQENYMNFRLSFSLGDKWFKKLEIF